MGLKRRVFTKEFKMLLLEEIESGKALNQVAREYEINPNMLLRWKKEHRSFGIESFPGKGNLHKAEARIAELERLVGKLTLENDFLKKVLKQQRGTKLGKKGIER